MTDVITIQSGNAEETEQLGADIGSRLRGGEIIELISDLGSGKTTFTRGLASGAGSADQVASPTFTVSKVYKAHGFDIHHFDFYRLTEAGLMEHELADVLNDPKIVIVIEWGEIVRHILPDNRLTIEINQIDAERRDIRLTVHESLTYLLENK